MLRFSKMKNNNNNNNNNNNKGNKTSRTKLLNIKDNRGIIGK